MTQKLENRVLGPKESWYTNEAQVHFCWTFKSYLSKFVGWFCWWRFVEFFCGIFSEEAEAV